MAGGRIKLEPTLANYERLWQSAGFWRVLGQTLQFSLLGALFRRADRLSDGLFRRPDGAQQSRYPHRAGARAAVDQPAHAGVFLAPDPRPERRAELVPGVERPVGGTVYGIPVQWRRRGADLHLYLDPLRVHLDLERVREDPRIAHRGLAGYGRDRVPDFSPRHLAAHPTQPGDRLQPRLSGDGRRLCDAIDGRRHQRHDAWRPDLLPVRHRQQLAVRCSHVDRADCDVAAVVAVVLWACPQRGQFSGDEATSKAAPPVAGPRRTARVFSADPSSTRWWSRSSTPHS